MCNVMVVEDNMNIVSFYQKFLTKEKDINLVGISYNGETAIEMYKDLKPDLLILDLDLPKINGLEVINQLCLLENTEKKCNIIVVSGNSALRQQLFNTKKVYGIVPKIDINNMLQNVIEDFVKDFSVNEFPMKKLTDLLLELNLNPYSNSCSYLIDAITLAYTNNKMLDNIQKIYDIIAFRSNCSSQKIKSSIRSSIRTANRFTSSELLCSIFFITQYDYNKILSPKHFLNCIVYYLNNTYSE